MRTTPSSDILSGMNMFRLMLVVPLLAVTPQIAAGTTPIFEADLPMPGEELEPTLQRTSLRFMTFSIIAAQYITVGIFHNDSDWKTEGHRFVDGFTKAPVWDDDSWVFNYFLHPWVGSEYYLVARNRDWTVWGSLAYSAALSTFFEYFAENLLQQPSATDLLVTPLVGALVGEARYALKERIRRRPAATRGARFWISALDPVDISLGGYPDGRPRLYLNWKHAF